MVKNVIILKLLSKSLTTEWNLLNRPIIFKIIIDARIKKRTINDFTTEAQPL